MKLQLSEGRTAGGSLVTLGHLVSYRWNFRRVALLSDWHGLAFALSSATRASNDEMPATSPTFP